MGTALKKKKKKKKATGQKLLTALPVSVCLSVCLSPDFLCMLVLFFSKAAHRLPFIRKYRHRPLPSYISFSNDTLTKSWGKPC